MNSTGFRHFACVNSTKVCPAFRLRRKYTCVPTHSGGPSMHLQCTIFPGFDSITFILQNPKSMMPPTFGSPSAMPIHQSWRPSTVASAR